MVPIAPMPIKPMVGCSDSGRSGVTVADTLMGRSSYDKEADARSVAAIVGQRIQKIGEGINVSGLESHLRMIKALSKSEAATNFPSRSPDLHRSKAGLEADSQTRSQHG